MKQNPSGFHTSLTPDVHRRIIEAVPTVYVKTHVAGLARIHVETLRNWMSRGSYDHGKGIETPFAHLFADYHEALGKAAQELVYNVQTNPDAVAGNKWLLERAFREEFGADSAEIKELRAMFTQIMAQKGMTQDGDKTKELDCESNKE